MPTLTTLFQQNRSIRIPKGKEHFLSGYADASFSSGQGSGWGIWVRGNSQRIIRSGVCPDWVSSSDQAELVAVHQAVKTAVEEFDEPANILVVKTDSQAVCRWFGWKTPKIRFNHSKPEITSLVASTFELALQLNLKLIVTWVKGHRGNTGEVKDYLNYRVDRLANNARKFGQEYFFKGSIEDPLLEE